MDREFRYGYAYNKDSLAVQRFELGYKGDTTNIENYQYQKAN